MSPAWSLVLLSVVVAVSAYHYYEPPSDTGQPSMSPTGYPYETYAPYQKPPPLKNYMPYQKKYAPPPKKKMSYQKKVKRPPPKKMPPNYWNPKFPVYPPIPPVEPPVQPPQGEWIGFLPHSIKFN